jgi:phosphoadenosine phosphosulfate reductase
MSAVTVIGAQSPHHIGHQPIAFTRLAQLRASTDGRDATGILRLALNEEFAGRTAVVSSFGAESGVLLHLVAQVDPTTPILFINTGKLFGETLRYRDRLQDVLGLTDIRTIGPHPIARAATDPEGTLWSRDPDACCAFRKVQPLKRALAGFAAQITGRKRFQTSARVGMERVEYFDARFRFNPLHDWSLADLDAYVAGHQLPKHPLVDDGYASIGCMPCTRRLRSGEAYREGRWAGLEKDECGIHTGLDGEGI